MGQDGTLEEELSVEERLKSSEARLRQIQALAQVGSWEADLASGRIWASEEAYRIYGTQVPPGQEMSLQQVQGFTLAQYRPLLDAALRALVERGEHYDVMFQVRRESDGGLRDVHSYAELVRDEQGRAWKVLGSIQDVTAHMNVVRELKASEDRSRMILTHAADAILLGGEGGRLIDVNERACELSGYSRDELLGQNISVFFSPEVLAQGPLRYDLIDRGEVVVNQRELTRKDGCLVPIEMRTKKLPDGTYQAILRDTSERAKLQEQQLLRQRMDSIGTLAGGIAHDFNNILVAIIGYSEILGFNKETLNPLQLECVGNILSSCRRASALVSNLSALTRAEKAEKTDFDLYKITNEVFSVLVETTDKMIPKKMLVPSGKYFVHGNESDLYHALMNLGINAIQAVEQKGVAAQDFVGVEASLFTADDRNPLGLAVGDYIQLVVRDTGAGMPEEVRRRAFDPLFTTKTKGERKGQGLGLTMVYHTVVHQHRGHIAIETLENQGTKFNVYLPAAKSARAAAPSNPSVAYGSETILLVDDEPMIVSFTRQILEMLGYRVLTAHDGQEGLSEFQKNKDRIDLVLLDRTMPKLSGDKVLYEIMRECPKCKVIIMSGDASLVKEEVPLACGILRKPYSMEELSDALRSCLGKGSGVV